EPVEQQGGEHPEPGLDDPGGARRVAEHEQQRRVAGCACPRVPAQVKSAYAVGEIEVAARVGGQLRAIADEQADAYGTGDDGDQREIASVDLTPVDCRLEARRRGVAGP